MWKRILGATPALTTAALLLAFLPLASWTSATEGAVPKKTVRIGLVNTLYDNGNAQQSESLAGPFTSLMESHLGIVSQLVIGGDAELLAAQLKSGKLQLGVFNGFEFARVRVKNPDLQPLVITADRQPFARAVLVVRKDNGAANPAALEGKILAVPLLAREHCRLFVKHRCVGRGREQEKWFAKVATPRTAQDALDDVAQNYAQGAVVDDVDFAAFRKEFPKTAARLRVLAESEKFPCGVIGYQPGNLDAALIMRLRTGMIMARMTEDGRKLLDVCRITSFEAVPVDFEQNLAAILKAYPPEVETRAAKSRNED